MNCPKCGKPVQSNAAFCRYCGMRMGVQPAPAGKICPTCGVMLAAQAKFCSKCGTRMDEQPKPLICASCGSQLPIGSLFCNKCGGRVDQTPKASVCPGCGAQLAPDFLFCNLCGTPCAGAPTTAQKDEKTEPVSSFTPDLLPNTEPTMPEPEILSAEVSATESALDISPDTVIALETEPIKENESAVICVMEPVAEIEPPPESDIAATPMQELAFEEVPAPAVTVNTCPTCGKEFIPGMAFCIDCGARLIAPQAEPVAVSEPEPVAEIEPAPEPDIAATPMQELAFEEVPAPEVTVNTCPACGKECVPGMAFCIGCGARLTTPQSALATVSVPEPIQDIEIKPEPDIAVTPMQELAFEEVPVTAQVTAANVCPTCGKERIPGMAFCTGCGARLSQPELAAASVPVIAPVAAPIMPPVEFSAKPFVIERIQMPEPESQQPAPAWQSVCASCGMVVASGLRNCPRCGAKV